MIDEDLDPRRETLAAEPDGKEGVDDMKRISVAVSVISCGLSVSSSAGDMVVNGDFSAGLTGWFADGDVAVGGPADSALLGEGSPFPGPPPGLLEQTFTLAADPISLSFEFDFDSSPGGAAGSFFDDLFQVELIATGLPELFTDSFGFPSDAILAVDRFGVFENQGSIGAGAVLDNLFTLDLTGLGLSAGNELTLTYLMFGGDDGFISVGLVDDASLITVPVPGSALLAMFALAPGAMWRLRRRSAV